VGRLGWGGVGALCLGRLFAGVVGGLVGGGWSFSWGVGWLWEGVWVFWLRGGRYSLRGALCVLGWGLVGGLVFGLGGRGVFGGCFSWFGVVGCFLLLLYLGVLI